MWKWMNAILETNTAFTNYAFLEQTLASTLNDAQKLQSIRSKYWETDESLANAVQRIGQP